MINWFKKEAQTVESILSTFTTTIKNLEAHAEAKFAEETEHNVLIDFYKNASTLANDEMKKARTAISKLKAIFN